MSKLNFKIGFLAMLIFVIIFIIASFVNAGLIYLAYGVMLSWAFPELPSLSFWQYFAIGFVMTLFINILKK